MNVWIQLLHTVEGILLGRTVIVIENAHCLGDSLSNGAVEFIKVLDLIDSAIICIIATDTAKTTQVVAR